METKEKRDALIVDLRVNQKLKIDDICARVGLCDQTVHRILRSAGIMKMQDRTCDFWKLHDATLIRLYSTTSMTYAEIAAVIGAPATGSSVNTRVRRMMLDGRIAERKPRSNTPIARVSVSAVEGRCEGIVPPRAPPKPLPEKVAMAFVPSPSPAGVTRRTFWQLGRCHCRWQFDDELFCGAAIVPGKSYCDEHVTASRRSLLSPSATSSQPCVPR